MSDPVKCIDEIDVDTVANFCEIFAQVSRRLGDMKSLKFVTAV